MLFELPSLPLFVHTAFEMLAISVGMAVYRRSAKQLIPLPDKLYITSAAMLGAVIGCKLPPVLENIPLLASANGFLTVMATGKSILGAILGAWLCIELVKLIIGYKKPTGDAFAFALMAGIFIGRIGCFLCGLDDHTYGIETSLPWAVDFGDGVFRHPLQLYEMLFMAALYGAIKIIQKSTLLQMGDSFKLFILGYFSYRFLVEWIKPMPDLVWGFTPVQVLAFCGLILLCVQTLPRFLSGLTKRKQMTHDN